MASPSYLDPTPRPPGQRLLFICDWLPPDFGAVGQYTVQRAQQLAGEGHHVTVLGFASTAENTGEKLLGRLRVIRLNRSGYDKSRFLKRAWWTLQANFALLHACRTWMRDADEVIFTSSPPYFLHFIAPFNLFYRKKLVYRISDFHPECLMAEYTKPPLWLRVVFHLTMFWRRRIGFFEAIGEDQQVRLRALGFKAEHMRLVRDPAPVAFPDPPAPSPKPQALQGAAAILYSGNFGVAHDHQTFLDGYRAYCQQSSAKVSLWLNAVGKKADLVERSCLAQNLPVHRSQPVPLSALPGLLQSADLHLITLRDEFVGYVLPSKVYACIESRRPILFVGSADSDVHLLCRTRLSADHYRRVEIGDSAGVAAALKALLIDRG